MKFVLYQMDVKFGKPVMNLEKVKSFLQQNQPSSGSFVIIPELFLTGYHQESISSVSAPLDDHKFIDQLIDSATEYEISIFGSLPISFEGKTYNTAIIVDKTGVVSHYKKSHLFRPMNEDAMFSSGREIEVTPYNDIKYGLSVCYDLRFPELYQVQAKEGAEFLLICAEWPDSRVDHWKSLIKARAIENQSYAIGVNQVGSDPDYTYGGHSVVYSPYGLEIAALNHMDEDSITVDIDKQEIYKFRDQFDVKQDKWINMS